MKGSIAKNIDDAAVYLQAIKDHLAAEERLTAAASKGFKEWYEAAEQMGESFAYLHNLVEAVS